MSFSRVIALDESLLNKCFNFVEPKRRGFFMANTHEEIMELLLKDVCKIDKYELIKVSKLLKKEADELIKRLGEKEERAFMLGVEDDGMVVMCGLQIDQLVAKAEREYEELVKEKKRLALQKMYMKSEEEKEKEFERRFKQNRKEEEREWAAERAREFRELVASSEGLTQAFAVRGINLKPGDAEWEVWAKIYAQGIKMRNFLHGKKLGGVHDQLTWDMLEEKVREHYRVRGWVYDEKTAGGKSLVRE